MYSGFQLYQNVLDCYCDVALAQVSNMCENGDSNASTPVGSGGGVLPNPTATWPNLQETLQFERAATAIMNDRPHTISTGKFSLYIPAMDFITQGSFLSWKSCHFMVSPGKPGVVWHCPGTFLFYILNCIDILQHNVP